ncbi:MAG: RHS repeat-associated core domain-containing protein [Terracidiphilus sp.]|jgi:RHS repeat-associated protein
MIQNERDQQADTPANGFMTASDYVLGLGGEQVAEMAVNSVATPACPVANTPCWHHANVWAGGKLLGTYDKDGLHFYFDDPLGTRRAQTDSTGVLEQTCASLPYGDGLACTGGDLVSPTEHHFTGKERDTESGNDYFGARYYSSAMGRFMSPDPLSGSIADPQSLNRYVYAQNTPLIATDPTGMKVSWEDSNKKCEKGETTPMSDVQRKYEKNIHDLINSKNKKDRERGSALEATYQRLDQADETFHVVRESGNGSGELTYKGHPGDLYIELQGDGASYGMMPDIQKVGHEMKHGEQFLDGLIGFALSAKTGKWEGYRDDLVDEANAFMAGFMVTPVGKDQSKFLQGLFTASKFGLSAVIDKLNSPGSPYYGRSTVEVPVTTITPSIYAKPPRSQ